MNNTCKINKRGNSFKGCKRRSKTHRGGRRGRMTRMCKTTSSRKINQPVSQRKEPFPDPNAKKRSNSLVKLNRNNLWSSKLRKRQKRLKRPPRKERRRKRMPVHQSRLLTGASLKEIMRARLTIQAPVRDRPKRRRRGSRRRFRRLKRAYFRSGSWTTSSTRI